MNYIQVDDIETLFIQATKQIHTLPKRPTDEILLRLHGLYKQAME